MTLFRLKQSQNESSLTQNGVKKHKKVSKFKILNKTCLKRSEMIQYLKLWYFFDFEHAKKLCNLNSSSYFP